MRIDVQVLINQVKSILLAIIAKNVLLFVRIAQFHHLASDQVADASPQINEGEAFRGDPET